MMDPRSRVTRNRPVLQSTAAAAWLTGALLLGRLTHEYIKVGSPPKTPPTMGQRSATASKALSPSQLLAPEPEVRNASAKALLGAMGAVLLIFGTFGAGLRAPPTSNVELDVEPQVQTPVVESSLSSRRPASQLEADVADTVVKESPDLASDPEAKLNSRIAASDLDVHRTVEQPALYTTLPSVVAADRSEVPAVTFNTWQREPNVTPQSATCGEAATGVGGAAVAAGALMLSGSRRWDASTSDKGPACATSSTVMPGAVRSSARLVKLSTPLGSTTSTLPALRTHERSLERAELRKLLLEGRS